MKNVNFFRACGAMRYPLGEGISVTFWYSFFFPGYRAKNLSPGKKMTFPGNAISWVPGKKLGAPGKKYMFSEEKCSRSKEVRCCVYEVLACPKLSSKVLTKLTQNTKDKNFSSSFMSG